MASPPFYDRRPATTGRAACPRCKRPVQVSRCRTAAREICGRCGRTFLPATIEEVG